MAPANRRIVSGMIVVALIAVGASACGRKGPLDPPTAALSTADTTTAPADTAPAKPDKKFILDPLIK